MDINNVIESLEVKYNCKAIDIVNALAQYGYKVELEDFNNIKGHIACRIKTEDGESKSFVKKFKYQSPEELIDDISTKLKESPIDDDISAIEIQYMIKDLNAYPGIYEIYVNKVENYNNRKQIYFRLSLGSYKVDTHIEVDIAEEIQSPKDLIYDIREFLEELHMSDITTKELLLRYFNGLVVSDDLTISIEKFVNTYNIKGEGFVSCQIIVTDSRGREARHSVNPKVVEIKDVKLKSNTLVGKRLRDTIVGDRAERLVK